MNFTDFLDQSDYIVCYHPELARILGGVKVAIVCDKLRFFSTSPNVKKTDDGWFRLDLKYIAKMTGMSRHEVGTASEILSELKVAETKWDGFQHRTLWNFHREVLDQLGREFMEHPTGAKVQLSEGAEPATVGRSESGPIDRRESATSIEERESRRKRIKKKESHTPSFVRTIFPSSNGNGHPEVKLSKQELREQFLPVARVIAASVKSKYNIRLPDFQVRKWCKDLQRLYTENGVPYDRQLSVATEFAEKSLLNPKYCPIVKCGASFRDKFTKVLEFFERQNGHSNGNGKVRPGGAKRVEGRGEFKYGEEFTFE